MASTSSTMMMQPTASAPISCGASIKTAATAATGTSSTIHDSSSSSCYSSAALNSFFSQFRDDNSGSGNGAFDGNDSQRSLCSFELVVDNARTPSEAFLQDVSQQQRWNHDSNGSMDYPTPVPTRRASVDFSTMHRRMSNASTVSTNSSSLASLDESSAVVASSSTVSPYFGYYGQHSLNNIHENASNNTRRHSDGMITERARRSWAAQQRSPFVQQNARGVVANRSAVAASNVSTGSSNNTKLQRKERHSNYRR